MKKLTKLDSIIKLRIILWSIFTLIVLWLFGMAIVPGGEIIYINDFEKNNFFIQKLTPAERVEEAEDGTQKIVGDPVYFSLRTSRRFDRADIEVKYKNNSDLPIIETGVLVDKVLWRYETKPIENKIIDHLSMVWDVIKDGDVVLLQKEKKYSAIGEFLDNLPPRNEIALYNYNLKANYLLPDYKPDSKKIKMGYVLRGPFQFYTYIKDENFDFVFSFLDVNANKDKDYVDINLYYNNQIIASKRIDDNDIPEESNKLSDMKKIDFKLANLPEGVYKVEVKTNDDIFTKEIETSQKKIAFINSVRLADFGEEDLTMHTDGNRVSAQTLNPERLQTITVDEKKLELSETYKQFDLISVSDNSKEIKIAKDDIMLFGDGVFSFEKSELINPAFKKIDFSTSINIEKIYFVLADYKTPDQSGEWRFGRTSLDLSNAYREFNKYSFILSVPGLKDVDGGNNNIEIDNIKIHLYGKSLWQKVKEIF